MSSQCERNSSGPADPLELRLIGPLSLRAADGTDATPRSTQLCAILALLGAAPGQRRRRSWLQDKLWSRSAPAQAAASLRQSLARLRRALGARSGIVLAQGEWVGLDPGRVRILWTIADAAPLDEAAEFCEGLDLDDPEFEHWLRDQRLALSERAETRAPDRNANPNRRPGRGVPPRVVVVASHGPRGATGRLAQAFTELLVAALSDCPHVSVVAPAAGPTVAGRGPIAAIGRAADARYIVLTRVVGADTPQVVTHLVETRTSVIHWSARALLTPGDGARELADRADGVAGELGGLHGPIVRLERQRLRTAEGDSLDAHDCYLRAADGIDCDDRESALAALGFARRCTDLDPQFARGWMMLGWRRNQVYSYRWDAPGPGWLAEEQTIFRRAVDLAPRDPVALGFLALSRAKLGAAAEAQRLARHAADVGAADPEAATELSLMLSTIAGEPARALAMIDRAFDRSSDPPARWGFMATRAAFFAGAFVRALATSDAAPDCLPKLVYRSLSAAELGDLAEARASMKRLFARVPHFSFDWYARNQGISHPAARDRYRSAAAKVGAAAAH